MNQPRHPFKNVKFDRPVEEIPDFNEEPPLPFPNVGGGLKGAEGVPFSKFLNEWRNSKYQENLWWKFDKNNRIIGFGLEGRKFFLRIAEIVISFQKNKKFSGNLLGRIRILQDLNVTHVSSPETNEQAFENGGQRNDIIHFRWMVAAVVRTAFPKTYHDKISYYFRLFFSEIFTVTEGVKYYFVSQLFHPIFFNSSDRCSLIRMIKDLHNLNPSVFKKHFTLECYGFRSWWSRIRVGDEAFNRVLNHKTNFRTLYSFNKNGCALPLYIRNVHDHFFRKNGSCHEDIDFELDKLFPGVSAVIIDSAIRNLHTQRSVFGSTATTLANLQSTPPYGWCFSDYRYH